MAKVSIGSHPVRTAVIVAATATVVAVTFNLAYPLGGLYRTSVRPIIRTALRDDRVRIVLPPNPGYRFISTHRLGSGRLPSGTLPSGRLPSGTLPRGTLRSAALIAPARAAIAIRPAVIVAPVKTQSIKAAPSAAAKARPIEASKGPVERPLYPEYE